MSDRDPLALPRLRRVDVQPSRQRPGAYDLHDSSGIATSALTVSAPTLSILACMDGRHDRPSIQARFMLRYGRMLFSDELDRLIRQLDEALFLEGPQFDAHMARLAEQYRRRPGRPIRDVHSLGAPVDRLGAYLDELFDHRAGAEPARGDRLLGLVAPHLDYERGGPCYAAAYRGLGRRTGATRFVILGTNHFGRSRAVVGTRMDFETPFGLVPHDGAFMQRLDARCGRDLSEHEYDHLAEHSIELQVILLKHLLGDREFVIAPYLCPDPCGPSGTAPDHGDGVDLKDFAAALRAEIAADDRETCLIAGADLSHVGRFFMDDRELDADTLHAVEASDRQALSRVEAVDAEGLRRGVAEVGNDTNICSVGCLYALTAALPPGARPRLLHYHQAVTREAQNCVTCAAMEFVAGGP